MPYRLAKLIGNIVKQNSGLYDTASVLKDVELYRTLKKRKKQHKVVHYLNAERDIRYVVNNTRLFENTFFCGTFHKPKAILASTISDNNYLQKLNGAIAVGVNQVDFLKNWLDIENVKYIPHGVDTTFFTQDITKRKTNNLLFVGQHLRDFDALNYCVPRLAEKIKNLEVNVVLRKDFFKKINKHSSIKLHSNIDDNKLKAFYQEASALFLPMINSTACNSILEALASGTPIITTNVGGNEAYLKGTNNILVPMNDLDYLIEATITILNDESRMVAMSNSSRLKAQEFEWQKIAKEVSGFYDLL